MAYSGYNRLRVLVVDDFDSFRMTVSKILTEFGVEQVDTSANGQDAIKACASKRYDLILCDYNLGPGKTGQQVLEELRQRDILSAGSLFCLVSAESSKSIVLAAYDAGPHAYLTKPITAKTLQQRLDRLLAERDEMISVHKHLAEGNTSAAIDDCLAKIANRSRYASSCQKILAQLYLDSDQVEAAEKIYQQVLEVRILDWAQLGLATVKQRQGDLSTAGTWLEGIITKNPLCMQAYDILAENCRLQNDDLHLQQVLQQAVNVSPMSFGRQNALAKTARDNNDPSVAAQAYKRSVRLGQHSCYDSVETHLEFARMASALFKEDPAEAQDLARDALRTLDALTKNSAADRGNKLQSNLLEVQLYSNQGDKKRADTLLKDVEAAIEEENLNLDLDTSLDFAQSLVATGQAERSKSVVATLIEDYKDDQEAMNKIDRILEEPASDANRKKVGMINKKGIQFYEQKKFSEAIDLFSRAGRMFPNHVGVQLNLAQALLGEMREYGVKQDSMELCLTALSKTEEKMTPNHAQMKRYRQLSEMVKTIDRESKRA